MEDKNTVRIISRLGHPGKLDTADYKTICKVICRDKIPELYIQLSHDTDIPRWERIGKWTTDDALLKLVSLIK